MSGKERQLLWHSLRERAENDQLYRVELLEAGIPPEVLMVLLGIMDHQAIMVFLGLNQFKSISPYK